MTAVIVSFRLHQRIAMALGRPISTVHAARSFAMRRGGKTERGHRNAARREARHFVTLSIRSGRRDRAEMTHRPRPRAPRVHWGPRRSSCQAGDILVHGGDRVSGGHGPGDDATARRAVQSRLAALLRLVPPARLAGQSGQHDGFARFCAAVRVRVAAGGRRGAPPQTQREPGARVDGPSWAARSSGTQARWRWWDMCQYSASYLRVALARGVDLFGVDRRLRPGRSPRRARPRARCVVGAGRRAPGATRVSCDVPAPALAPRDGQGGVGPSRRRSRQRTRRLRLRIS